MRDNISFKIVCSAGGFMAKNKTVKSAKLIGVILVLASMAFATPKDTFKVFVKFSGDIGFESFKITAVPHSSFPGTGGTVTTMGPTALAYQNLPVFWTAKISISGNGYQISPQDTQIVDLMGNITLNITVKDTSRPSVKIGYQQTEVTISQSVTFYDSLKDNTGRIANLRNYFSTNNGITWDSLSYQQGLLNVSRLIFTGYPQSFIPTIPSDNFLLRTIAVDPFGLADTSIATFRVVYPLKTISIISPQGGDYLSSNTQKNISWSSSNDSGVVSRSIWFFNGKTWSLIDSSPATSAGDTYNWTTPNAGYSTCKVSVRVYDAVGGVSVGTSNSFTIHGLPVISVTAPNSGEIWSIKSTRVISWSGKSDSSFYHQIINHSIFLSSDSGMTWIPISTASGNPGTYSWNIPDSSGYLTNKSFIKITAQGLTGDSTSDISDIPFFVIGQPLFISPSVVSILPGSSFSYRLTYMTPGNPPSQALTVVSKPEWVNVSGDSLFGNSPVQLRTDTVKVTLKAGDLTTLFNLVIKLEMTSIESNVSIKENSFGIYTRAGKILCVLGAGAYAVSIFDLSGKTLFHQNAISVNKSHLPLPKLTLTVIVNLKQGGRELSKMVLPMGD
jgi:hypothetical protein